MSPPPHSSRCHTSGPSTRLPAASFTAFGELRHAQVASVAVRPLAPPTVVGDLVELHDRAGIDLRVVEMLWPYVDAWMPTTLGCSAIRMANARPRE